MVKNLRDKPRQGPTELGEMLGAKSVPNAKRYIQNEKIYEGNIAKIKKQIEMEEISDMLDDVEEDEMFLQWLRRNGFDV